MNTEFKGRRERERERERESMELESCFNGEKCGFKQPKFDVQHELCFRLSMEPRSGY